MKRRLTIVLLLSAVIILLGGCGVEELLSQTEDESEHESELGSGSESEPESESESGSESGTEKEIESATGTEAEQTPSTPEDDQSESTSTPSDDGSPHEDENDAPNEADPSSRDQRGSEDNQVEVVTDSDSVAVLVNKAYALPQDYTPTDLVYPDVPFIFEEKIEKRKMREEAARALERLFSAAEQDQIYLLGVSAYRSYETQEALFNAYVEEDGYEVARQYSALPGQSEHQTGLAIDVTGQDQTCVVEDCFANTIEAQWLAEHAAEYGFIIRYLEGKESITGYKYEPWHLRYVGEDMAKKMVSLGVTMEEYMDAVPVSQ
ncbi:M15 family metallopeptidase [Caldalkalibacillus salinus]|uniref:M15 family metallopeptidase n=1 Tax=Caldalkalibacillus salinus TaxID=2803787 RepID=UPI0019247105|nr:M15 family metallopeptidase [Caldalkalibacillus salinus]